MKVKRKTRWTWDKILDLRLAYRYTQGEFCRLLAVSPSAVAMYESGRSMPREKTLRMLDNVEDDLVSGRAVPKPKRSDKWKNASAKQCVG